MLDSLKSAFGGRAERPSADSPRPSKKRKLLLFGIPVLATLLGIWGAKPIGSVASSYLGGLMGTSAATGPAIPHREPIEAELRRAAQELGLPAQIAITYQWSDLCQKVATQLGTRPNTQPSPNAVSSAVKIVLSDKANWISGRGLWLSTFVPASILHSAAQSDMLTPFAFIIGTVAITLAQPLLYRLAGQVRIWSTTPTEREKQAGQGTWFQRGLSRMGLSGSLQPGPFHDGRYYRQNAGALMDWDLNSALQNPNEEEARQQVGLSILDVACSFPEAEIDPLWGRRLYLRLKQKFGSEEAVAAIRGFLKNAAPHFEVKFEQLEEHLKAMLIPEPWVLADAPAA